MTTRRAPIGPFRTVEWAPAGPPWPLDLGSRLTLMWRPPIGTPPGTYRLGVRGAARGFRRWLGGRGAGLYSGHTAGFQVGEAAVAAAEGAGTAAAGAAAGMSESGGRRSVGRGG